MKNTLTIRAARFALVIAMAIATSAVAQTGSKPNENESGSSQTAQEKPGVQGVRPARTKRTPAFSTLRSGTIATASPAKTFDAAAVFGTGPNRRSSGYSQTSTPGDDAQALAKKLANPISSLISVPFQNNFDFGMGPNRDGFRYTMNFQPVIPFALSKDWNLISRTIVPVIAQHKVAGTGTQFGLGDTFQSFFFSPNKSEPFVWGIGPALLIPTATDKALGTEKFAIGPTIVVLKQKKKWTVGMLFNHVWSVAGKESRADVSSTFLQPFLSYTTKTAWTFTVNTESTYDWNGKSWGVPVHFQAAKLVKMGKQPVSVGGGLRCWITSAPGGPRWCGFRFIFTPLFPKK